MHTQIPPLRGVEPAAPPTPAAQDPYRALLLLRYLLVNLTGFALLAVAWQQGWVAAVVAGDSSRLVFVIAGVFLFGLLWSAKRAFDLAFELDQTRAPEPHPDSFTARFLRDLARAGAARRGQVERALELELAGDLAPLRHLASSLVLLGLVGTVLGFIVALSGVDPKLAADVSAIGPMVARLIEGLGIALYTTLVGTLLNLWLATVHRLLEGGATKLASRLLRRSAGAFG